MPHESSRFGSVREKVLALAFVLTLPMANPWVRGDGVGYYAFARALLIDHNLRFEKDWLAANPSFRMSRVDANGGLAADQFTRTGYINNHFTVGPAVLWAPFLIVVHGAVLGLDRLGAHIAADGFSRPYRVAMALATAFYGFLGLLLSFRLARSYFAERWAFLGTVGIWFASSLPVYMYFNPSWSHAHSAFVVALFLWYWHRTRSGRTLGQWFVLGLLSGLMIDVYYPNAVLLLVPALESLRGCWRIWHREEPTASEAKHLFLANLLYAATIVLACLPTLVTRAIIYGSVWESGHPSLHTWNWISPALWSVLFSADHGLLAWTPIVIPAVLGLLWLRKQDREFAEGLLLASLAFYYLIASYSLWDGISSFGNRFFVSLTPIFVLGLAAALDAFGKLCRSQQGAFAAASSAVAVLIVWNLGFIFQWGTELVPTRGAISWRQMAYNQVAVVPVKILHTAKGYLLERGSLMQEIEKADVDRLKRHRP